MLVRLLYASRAVGPVTPQIIESILQQSFGQNPALGITGVLCHGADVYMQALEGGREAVNALYMKIARDTRHRDVMLLHYAEVPRAPLRRLDHGPREPRQTQPVVAAEVLGQAGARSLCRLGPGLDGAARGIDRKRADHLPRRRLALSAFRRVRRFRADSPTARSVGARSTARLEAMRASASACA